MSKLTGKIALVTGASKGIGAGIAKAFGREGATVVVNFVSDSAGANNTAKAITEAGGKAVVLGGSVAVPAERQTLFAEIQKQFGKLDILVNNAGVYGWSALEMTEEAEFDRQYNTNVKGLLFTTKAALPLFGPEGGSIINISSVVATRSFPNSSVYASTKGAVDTITRVLSAELGPKKIRVNALSPGLIMTEGAKTFMAGDDSFEKQVIATTPLGRVGQPDDIADVALFLASDDARWVTGAILEVAGGSR